MLSQKEILDNVAKKSICITDFSEEKLGHCTYQVDLGFFYYRKKKDLYMGFKCAANQQELVGPKKEFVRTMEIKPGFPGILLAPRESVLCHTNDCIGVAETFSCTFHPHNAVSLNMLQIVPQIIQPGLAQRICFSVYNPTDDPVPIMCGSAVGHVSFYHLGDSTMLYGSDKQVAIEPWHPNKMLPQNARLNRSIPIQTPESYQLEQYTEKDSAIKQINETETRLNKKKVRKPIALPQPPRNDKGEIIIPDALKPIETSQKKDEGEYVTKTIKVTDENGETVEKVIKDYVVPKPKHEIKYDATHV